MQSKTEIEKKLQVLRAILNGEIDLSILRPPQQYYIIQNTDGLYSIPGKEDPYNEQGLQDWLKGLRECDTVKILRPQPAQPLDAEQLTYEAPVIDIEYTEVNTAPEVIEIEDTPPRKQKAVKRAANKPQEVLTEVKPKQLITSGRLSEYGVSWGSICD